MSRYYRVVHTSTNSAGEPIQRVHHLKVPFTQSLPESLRSSDESFEFIDIAPNLIRLDNEDDATLFEIVYSSGHPSVYILGYPEHVKPLNSECQPIRPCQVLELPSPNHPELTQLAELLNQTESNLRTSREVIQKCQEAIAKDEATKQVVQTRLREMLSQYVRTTALCPRCQHRGDHWRELDHGGYYECASN